MTKVVIWWQQDSENDMINISMGKLDMQNETLCPHAVIQNMYTPTQSLSLTHTHVQ